MLSAHPPKKLLLLSAVGLALLLIPRRSSKKADEPLSKDCNANKNSERSSHIAIG